MKSTYEYQMEKVLDEFEMTPNIIKTFYNSVTENVYFYFDYWGEEFDIRIYFFVSGSIQDENIVWMYTRDSNIPQNSDSGELMGRYKISRSFIQIEKMQDCIRDMEFKQLKTSA